MSLATGARRRIGLATAREAARWFCTEIVDDQNGARPRGGSLLARRGALGAGAGPKEFRLTVAESARLWVREQLREAPRPWLAVGVGSRWLTKRWPPEHFAALSASARALRRDRRLRRLARRNWCQGGRAGSPIGQR